LNDRIREVGHGGAFLESGGCDCRVGVVALGSLVSRNYWQGVEDTEHALTPDEVREDRNDVTDAFAGKSGRGWLRTNCPMCERKTGKPDKKASLGYNTQTGGYNCHKCNSTGRLTFDQREQLPMMEPDVEEEQLPGTSTDPEPCWGIIELFTDPGLQDPRLEGARQYFLGRGLLAEVGRETGVGGATWGMNAGRVLVPFPNYESPGAKWKGWVGRAFRPLDPLPDGTAPPVYRYARRFKRDRYLYNEPVLNVETDTPVFVVEGVFDSMALWPDAVALLGQAVQWQVERLTQACRPVVICLDGDVPDTSQALVWHLQFRGVRAGGLLLPPKVDPDEVDRADLEHAALESIGCPSLVKVGW